MQARLSRFITDVCQSKINLRATFWPRLLAATALAVVLLPNVRASAQQLDGDFEGETEYVDKDGNSREITEPTSKLRTKVLKIFIQGKTSNKEDEQAIEDYGHYYVYALTWKKNLTKVAEKRKELKTKCLTPAGQKNRTVTDIHRRLNELALTTLRKVAEDARYPRAVRYNCMLTIGELDAKESDPGIAQPVPLPEATSAILQVAGDAKQHIAIRLAAVLALRRPTQLGIAADLQAPAATVLLSLMRPAAGEGNAQIGQIWLGIAAADVLHLMMQKQIPVDQTKFATALAALIANDKTPTWARAKLAGNLGRLDGRSLPAAQIGPAVRSLASLMLAISQASPFAHDENSEEGAEKEDDKKAADKKRPDKKDAEKKGADKKEDQAEQPDTAEEVSPTVQKLSSEEMIWQLSQIRLALFGKDAPSGKDATPSDTQGLHMAADDANKAAMKKIVSRIDELVKLLAVVPNDLAKLADTLRSANQDLENLLKNPPGGQAQTAKTNKAGVQRAAPPQGNAPAGASAVSE